MQNKSRLRGAARTHAHTHARTTMSSMRPTIPTIEAADSIAEMYADATDNLIDDAVRMETERDVARAQVRTLEDRNSALDEQVKYFATKFRELRDLVAQLTREELINGTPVGPVAFMASYEAPTGDITQEEIDTMFAEGTQ